MWSQSVTHKKENTKQSHANSISKFVAKKAKTNSNNSNNNKKWNKIKPETKTTVKVKMVKKLCA